MSKLPFLETPPEVPRVRPIRALAVFPPRNWHRVDCRHEWTLSVSRGLARDGVYVKACIGAEIDAGRYLHSPLHRWIVVFLRHKCVVVLADHRLGSREVLPACT
jgi:hypothetical protein